MTRHNYPTTEYGTPNGRNYTYRIHIDSPDFDRMCRIMRWNLRDITMNPKGVHSPFPFVAFRTFDRKGRVKGMNKWLFSPSWEPAPFGRGRYGSLEMRNANGGGTRLKGEAFVGYDDDDIRFDYVEIDTTVSFTPTEVRAILDGESGEYPDPQKGRPLSQSDAYDLIHDELFWAEQDAIESAKNAVYDARDDCEHKHAVQFAGTEPGLAGPISGYCEDCGEEFKA